MILPGKWAYDCWLCAKRRHPICTLNSAYVGTLATGNRAGKCLIAGPDWKGEKPEGSTGVIRKPQGPFTVHLGGYPMGMSFLSIMEGWNYIVRLCRPRKQELDGRWAFPSVEPVVQTR